MDNFDALLGQYHYLGEGHPAGDTMRMVAERDGEWLGLLWTLWRKSSALGWPGIPAP